MRMLLETLTGDTDQCQLKEKSLSDLLEALFHTPNFAGGKTGGDPSERLVVVRGVPAPAVWVTSNLHCSRITIRYSCVQTSNIARTELCGAQSWY